MKNFIYGVIMLTLMNASVGVSYPNINSAFSVPQYGKEDWSGICGNVDTREVIDQQDSEPNELLHVGRLKFIDTKLPDGSLVTATCSAFLVSNGTYLTAGHCFKQNYFDSEARGSTPTVVLEFRVPPSSDMGIPRPAEPEDRYEVIIPDDDSYSLKFDNNGKIKDDWAMFLVNANKEGSSLHRYPHFFRVLSSNYRLPTNDAHVLSYGYGINHDNAKRLMLHRGTGMIYARLIDIPFARHKIDVAAGDSGGVIYDQYKKLAVAMHSIGRCKEILNNSATSLAPSWNDNRTQTELFKRLNNYWNTRLAPKTSLTSGVEYKKTIHVDSHFHSKVPNKQGCYSTRSKCNGTFEYPATTAKSAFAEIKKLQETHPGPYLALFVGDNDIEKQHFVGKYYYGDDESDTLEFPQEITIFTPTGGIRFMPQKM